MSCRVVFPPRGQTGGQRRRRGAAAEPGPGAARRPDSPGQRGAGGSALPGTDGRNGMKGTARLALAELPPPSQREGQEQTEAVRKTARLLVGIGLRLLGFLFEVGTNEG